MKIALCISGQPRMYKKGYSELKEYYLDKYDVDVFIHTWKDKIYKGTEFYPEDKNNKQYEYTKEIFSDLIELYNPKSILIEDQLKFIEPDIISPTWRQSLQNCASMWYSVYKSNELRKHYEVIQNIKYDYVIRTRTDLTFEMPLIDLHTYDPSVITLHKWKTSYPQSTYGYKDCFAISGPDAMDKYCSLYNELSYYIFEDKNYKSFLNNEDNIRNEYLIKWHLLQNDVNVNDIDSGTNKTGLNAYR